MALVEGLLYTKYYHNLQKSNLSICLGDIIVFTGYPSEMWLLSEKKFAQQKCGLELATNAATEGHGLCIFYRK